MGDSFRSTAKSERDASAMGGWDVHTEAAWEAYKARFGAGEFTEGLERGVKLGFKEGQVDMLLLALEYLFGEVTKAQRARVLAAGIGQLKTWLLGALHTHSIEALLSDS